MTNIRYRLTKYHSKSGRDCISLPSFKVQIQTLPCSDFVYLYLNSLRIFSISFLNFSVSRCNKEK
ncbi:hypothetical protein HanXRQr2_Chr14g0642801 [Helianthus annuus]|uniref:Uncharacterized protein n=1 Tax=Helianthus annuus TaxID=4232 RepID=A0A9K3H7K6_HELAN|nr:hypothetical protein HanXRQr2_Chr14g0642801 [Helianthus annuus]KAJ0840268.1 hypothetical protein HanPSC8_Chr14g0616671 [Helianthus annuus]